METERPASAWLNQLGLSEPQAQPRAPEAAQREGLRSAATIGLLVLVLLGPIMTFGGVNLTSEGTVERQIGYILVFALALYASLPVLTRGSLVAVPLPTLVAFAWCWASLTWALDPASSVRRLVLTTTVAWTVFILVRHTRYSTIIDALRWTLVGAIGLSYLVVFADPSIGVHSMADTAVPTALLGNWRGCLGHKNFAGAVCAVCILLFLFDAKHIRPTVRIGVIVLSAYFLYQSQSKTSAGMLVLALIGGVMFVTLSRQLRAYLIPLVTLAVCLLWLGTSAYADFLTTNLLQPTAFTGRGQIWSTLMRYANDHPILGAGFGSFWNIQGTSPVFVYGQGYVTLITVGHSGYLDQLVTVGIPGVALMIFAVMVWPLWKLLIATNLRAEQGALIAAMLMFCIGHNVTESGLFERDAIVSTFLFLAAALAQDAARNEAHKPRQRDASGDDVMRTMRSRRRANGRLVEG